jgi:Transposase
MRKSRFSKTQIVEILKEGEAGLPVAELLRKHGISRATCFQRKAKYQTSDATPSGSNPESGQSSTNLPGRFHSERPDHIRR